MARAFLYLIAGTIVLVLGTALLLNIFAEEMTEMAFTPTVEFTPQPELPENAYADPALWISQPGLGAEDPALWRPQGLAEEEAISLRAAVFFIHPTSYFEREQWNAPVDEPQSRKQAELFVKGMASPFNRSADVWAPRYRQAAMGAFLSSKAEAERAIDGAYGDVLRAFDIFIATVAKDQPIVLAGHSQGAYHLRRLLHDRIAGTSLAHRIAVAFVIGWPVSLARDLPAMGLPACARPEQAGCVMSWLSFAEPADPGQLLAVHARRPGLDGQQAGVGALVCTNPLTGTAGGTGDASANLGTLVPDFEKEDGTLVPAQVPAACGKDGLLSIGAPPKLDLGPYVLPGNNYHLYDIVLFWANLRADAARRVEAWQAAH
jgi:hypothetical protein